MTKRRLKSEQVRARQIFDRWFAQTGNLKLASTKAGVTERTARRWTSVSGAAATPHAKNNLVASRDRFFGRGREVAGLRRLIAQGSRLIAVTGAPGVGKTRLAYELCRLLARQNGWAGGIWMCDCSTASEVGDLCEAVATASCIVHGDASRDADKIGASLATLGKTLLVLDNFEQLEASATGTVEGWLDGAAELIVVITSRRTVTTRGQSVWVLDGLPSPDPSCGDVRALATSDAIALFADRAQHSSGAAIGDDDLPAIADIVRLVDGLPLAIELAAARTRTVRPRELLDEFRARPGALATPQREAPTARATMYAALEASWSILSAAQKRALAHCSVFRGGFDLAAASAVFEQSDQNAWPSDVMAQLQAHSLVARVADTGDSNARFRLYEVVRQFAEAKLRLLGDADSAADRHAAHYVEIASQWIDRCTRLGFSRERMRFTQDQPNLEAAFRYVLAGPPTPTAQVAVMRAATVLAALAEHFRKHRARGEWARLALEFVDGSQDPATLDTAAALRAGLLSTLHRCRYVLRLPDDLDPAYIEQLAEDSKDALVIAQVLFERSLTLLDERAHKTAGSKLRRCVDIVATLDAPRLQARYTGKLGALCTDLNEPQTSIALLEQAIATMRSVDDIALELYLLVLLGWIHTEQGNIDSGKHCYRAAFKLEVPAMYEGYLAGLRMCYARLLRQLGEFAKARTLGDESIVQARRTGNRHFEANGLLERGLLCHVQGLYLQASDNYRASLACRNSPDPIATALLAAACSSLTQPQARQWIAQAQASDLQGDHAGAVIVKVCASIVALQTTEIHSSAKFDAAVADDAAIRSMTSRCHPDFQTAALLWAQARDRVRAKLPDPAGERMPIALEIAADGSSCSLSSGPCLDLTKHPRIARVLLTLAQARLDAPGADVASMDLFVGAWQDVGIRRESAVHRVQASISKLRNLGLYELILTGRDGYRLSEELDVAIAAPTRTTDHN